MGAQATRAARATPWAQGLCSPGAPGYPSAPQCHGLLGSHSIPRRTLGSMGSPWHPRGTYGWDLRWWWGIDKHLRVPHADFGGDRQVSFEVAQTMKTFIEGARDKGQMKVFKAMLQRLTVVKSFYLVMC